MPQENGQTYSINPNAAQHPLHPEQAQADEAPEGQTGTTEGCATPPEGNTSTTNKNINTTQGGAVTPEGHTDIETQTGTQPPTLATFRTLDSHTGNE
jgi:hypothetical protein